MSSFARAVLHLPEVNPSIFSLDIGKCHLNKNHEKKVIDPYRSIFWEKNIFRQTMLKFM